MLLSVIRIVRMTFAAIKSELICCSTNATAIEIKFKNYILNQDFIAILPLKYDF